MRFFITGGTGLIGAELTSKLLSEGHEITIYTRNIAKARIKFQHQASLIHFCNNIENPELFNNIDIVINLAGESIGKGRWSSARKKLLIDSRLSTTKRLVEQIKKSINPPKLFISGSAIGYYGSQGNSVLTEESAGKTEFTHTLCTEWEAIAKEAQNDKTRVAILRTGVVLSNKGGMIPEIIKPFKWGLGSIMGNGKQFFSWIHISDMINAMKFIIENDSLSGTINMTSPNPVTNKIFSKTLAKQLHRPCWFKIPSVALSWILGEASTLILGSQRAIPKKLLEASYKFKYTSIEEALEDIL